MVTGSSRGIGLAIAEQLIRDGFDITMSARHQGRLSEVAERLRLSGGEVQAVAGDVSVDEGISALVAAHLKQFDRLDLLVHCAGSGTAGPFAEYSISKLDRQIALHVRTPMLLTQRLLPLLRHTADLEPTTGSKIVALSSIAGVVAEPDLAAYGASKAALISLCESITVAEASNGLTATAISPGYVDTDMSSWVHDRVRPEVMIRATDIAVLVSAIARLSRFAAIPNIVVSRPGPSLWRA